MDAQKIKAKVGEIARLAQQFEKAVSQIGDAVSTSARQIRPAADSICLTLGEAEEVRVYDNGGVSFDRYTVFVGGDVYTMSSHPLSPQGMNQWAGKDSDFEGPNGFEISSGLLREDEIPPEVRGAIEQRRSSSCFNEGP